MRSQFALAGFFAAMVSIYLMYTILFPDKF